MSIVRLQYLRLGIFYMGLLTSHVELGEVVKLIIVISYVKVQAESDMPLNGEMVVENKFESVLTTKRMVHDDHTSN